MGRSQPVMVTKRAGQIRCNQWSDRMQTGDQVETIFFTYGQVNSCTLAAI